MGTPLSKDHHGRSVWYYLTSYLRILLIVFGFFYSGMFFWGSEFWLGDITVVRRRPRFGLTMLTAYIMSNIGSYK